MMCFRNETSASGHGRESGMGLNLLLKNPIKLDIRDEASVFKHCTGSEF